MEQTLHEQFMSQLEIKRIALDLVSAGVRLLEAVEEFRRSANEIAECDLSAWDLEDVERYVQLYI